MTSKMTKFVKGYKPPRVGCIECDKALTLYDSYGDRYKRIGYFTLNGKGPYCSTCCRVHNWNWINPDISYEQHMREVNRSPDNMMSTLKEVMKRRW